MTARRRVGVIGSFVWDVIHGRDPHDAPVEEWGGITYALGASTPRSRRLGDGSARQGRLRSRRSCARVHAAISKSRARCSADRGPAPQQPGVAALPERRNGGASGSRGGVPGWSWLGLKPLLADLDALYINLISGFELDLETAQLIRRISRARSTAICTPCCSPFSPTGCERCSRFRIPPRGAAASIFIQVNEDEMRMMAPDPLGLAAVAMAAGVSCLYRHDG